MSKKLYAERDYDEIEPYRMQHLMAMTAEGLHSKADIADELAYRDMLIERAEKATRHTSDVADLALSDLKKANEKVERLREALGKIILWIDGDTRAINRDVGIGNCDYNDIYESLDKLEKIAVDALEASA